MRIRSHNLIKNNLDKNAKMSWDRHFDNFAGTPSSHVRNMEIYENQPAVLEKLKQ